MKALALVFFAFAGAWAAVEGTVINQTTGKPQPAAAVTLYRLSQTAMEPVAKADSDAQGRFRLEQSGEGPLLIEAVHGGVAYYLMVQPGAPVSGLQLNVFDSTRVPGSAKVSQRMVLFEPLGEELAVTETVLFSNEGKTTYNDPARGTLRFYLPDAAKGEARVMAQAPQGMPVQKEARKTSAPGVYSVDFPIKPGETRFDVSYRVPFSGAGKFTGRAPGADVPIRLVAPVGVTIQGAGLVPLGQEPSTQASLFEVKGSEYTVEIQGTGTLRAQEAAAEDDSGPGIDTILPGIYDRAPWIAGLAAAILALGFVLLYRRGAPAPSPLRGKQRS